MDIPFWTRDGTIDLANLQPENLTAKRIGSTLAKINRFNGRTSVPWSVAAHSLVVEYLCPDELKPWALLHDAHEAFIGDITNTALDLICACGTATAVRNAVANAKGKLDRQIGAAWKTSVRSMSAELRRADHISLRAEAAVFIGVQHEFTEKADIDAFTAAIKMISEVPQSWPVVELLWRSKVETHAMFGRLTPPEFQNPASAVLSV